MPVNAPRRYLICYDIADPRRLGRVHRFLSSNAVPLQYSVFTGWYRRHELDEILAGLAEIIDSGEDDVRVYPLPASPRAVGIGRSFFPPGIMLVERGRDLLTPEDSL